MADFLRYMPSMALNSGINVRLDPHVRARLDKIAEKSGIKASVLIRHAIDEYCERIEKSGQLTIAVNSGNGAIIQGDGNQIFSSK